MKNPWVKRVVIGKEFPSTLSLRVIERSPIALVQILTHQFIFVLYTFGSNYPEALSLSSIHESIVCTGVGSNGIRFMVK